jgi:aspartyl-tRNA(Asn)/glutamyl-tRNA(Gln) amidotransferase subunit B
VSKETGNYKAAANWVIGPIKNTLAETEASLDAFPVTPSSIATLIRLIEQGTISYGIASQKIFTHLLNNPQTDIEQYIQAEGLQVQSGSEIDALIDASLTKHAEKITAYKKGKKGLLSLFVGEVMKLSKGKANAEEVTQKILEKLK